MKHAAKLRGALRHILTAGGGLLVALGYLDQQEATEGTAVIMTAVGAVITAVGFIWSIISKDKLAGNGDTA